MDPSQKMPVIETLDAPHIAVLSTLLDAHRLFQEPELSKDAFHPYFECIWPRVSLAQCLEELCEKGLVATVSGDYGVPKELRRELAAGLERRFFEHPVRLPGHTIGHEDLMKGFLTFALEEQQDLVETEGKMEKWGGWTYALDHRIHHILFRPFVLRLKAHSEEFILICTKLPSVLNRSISQRFVNDGAIQQRLALFDLEDALKMNLTKSGAAFYFERYLKRVLGVRIGSTATFNQSLEDVGLLSLRMG